MLVENGKTNHLRAPFAGPRPRVMAHRGSSGTHPENTITAFSRAVMDGADVLETDVRLTADGKVVAIHDRTVDRTTNATGDVSAMTYSAIRRLDAGWRFTTDGGVTYPYRGRGCHVPLLEEVLEAFPGMPFNVEIKDRDPRLVDQTVAIARRFNRLEPGRLLLAADHPRLMTMLRRASAPELTGHSRREVYRFLARAWLRIPLLFPAAKSRAIQLPATYRRWRVVTPGLVRCAHRLGMEVHVWTVNREEEMRRLLGFGVDGLFTDYPAILRKIVDEGGRPFA